MVPSPTENKRRMREYIEAWNDHDSDAIVDFLTEEYLRDGGEERLRASAETWFEAIPNLTNDVRELVAEDDLVLGRMVVTGTHSGTYEGIPPTGNEISISDHFSARFDGPKIAEYHGTVDLISFAQQLGLTSPFEGHHESENE